MRGATPLAVIEQMNEQKRLNRFLTTIMMGLGALVLFAEPIIEAIL